jgi:hypothetical protein
MQTMTRGNESSAATGDLLVAFELSQRWWKVGWRSLCGRYRSPARPPQNTARCTHRIQPAPSSLRMDDG